MSSAHPRVRLVVELVVALAGAVVLAWALGMDRHWLELHATPAFCFAGPQQAANARLKRALVFVAGAAVLVVVRPLVGRWAGRHTARALLANLGRLVVAPTVLALLVCEVILRHWPESPFAHYEPDSEVDPRLGWRPIPSHVTEMPVGSRTVRFVIDSDEQRVRSTEEPVDPSRPTIVFTGESVASGFGLPYEETCEAMVADRLHVQTINVAVQAYASDVSFLRLADALPRFPHLLATVTFALPAMIYRNVAPERPHLLFQPDGTWLTVPRTDHDWLGSSRVWDLAQSAIGFHSAEAARRAHDVMAATARVSRARGALPLVVVFAWTPCLGDGTSASSIDQTLFEGLDLPHAHVDIEKDMWDPVTHHPDVRGQAMIADAIVRELGQRGIGP